MAHVFIAIGSNLGDRLRCLTSAQQLLLEEVGASVFRASEIYETEPVGGPPQGKYLNAVWEFETKLSPEDLLEKLLGIENKLGRERSVPNAPRSLDLDILFYEDLVLESDPLVIPHPRLHERTFVLQPLMDLAPNWMHPVLKRTVKELYENLSVGAAFPHPEKKCSGGVPPPEAGPVKP